MQTRYTDYSGYGVDLGASKKIKGNFYTGLTAGLMHFKYLKNLYFPVALNLAYFPLKNINANAPYITFQPGYVIHNRKENYGRETIDADGGFTYFAGIGMMTKTNSRTRANFSLGYSHFGRRFKTTSLGFNATDVTYYSSRSSFGTLTLKIGLTLQK